MKNAYRKDIWRSILRGKKRFCSILLISALGVTMLTGIKAACSDLRYSADAFFDAQKLYDVCVVSTLGLTQEDVAALSELDGVETIEGSYSETVYTQAAGRQQSAQVQALSQNGLNKPYLLEGVLPQNADEIAVTEKYIRDTGKSIGDTLLLEEQEKEKPAGEPTANEDDEFNVDLDEEEETPALANTSFTITAVVINPMDMNTGEGSNAFRSSASTDYVFFVSPKAVQTDIYTAIYLTLSGADELACYSEDYKTIVAQTVESIETSIKDSREQARYDAVTGEAYGKVTDAEQEMEEQFAEADAEFADAQQELDDGYAALAEGEQELLESEQELNDGEAQLNQGKDELTKQQSQANDRIASARSQLENNQSQVGSEYATLTSQAQELSAQFGSMWPSAEWDALLVSAEQAYLPLVRAQVQIASLEEQMASLSTDSPEYTGLAQQLSALKEQVSNAQTALPEAIALAQSNFLNALSPVITAAIRQIDVQISTLDPTSPGYEEQLAAFNAQKQQLEALPQSLPQLAMGLAQLSATSSALSEQLDALSEQQEQAQAQFTAAWTTIAQQEAQLEDGRRKLEDGRVELEESRKKLEDGTAELTQQKQEYEGKRQEAEQKLEDAREEVSEIDRPKWYIQDRTSMSGYSNIENDASSIEAIGTAFPIVFFIVAILISLTTITRMVEEERGLIGTYKALGFTNREIRRKYLLYTFAACLLGGILGDIGGFVLLPKIIFYIFDTMYLVPEYRLFFDPLYGIGGTFLFMAGIAGAAALACRAELKQTPAALMRPKTPHSGSRIFLEYIPWIWKHFSFLNKVTARNLFRYKKRLFMTAAGIMGCTALVLCGFAIKDTVSDLMPKQYEQTYRYDLMAVSTADDNDLLLSYMEEGNDVSQYLNVLIDSAKLENAQGDEENVQLIVVPRGALLEDYILLEDRSGNPVPMEENGVYITQNASQVLHFGEGDTVTIQDSQLIQAEAGVTKIVKNYLGNTIYMTQDTYENLFGEFKPNSVLVQLSDDCPDQAAYADQLGRREGVLSSVSTEALKRDFSADFALVNMVVYVIIIFAAGLAFVVLFTLATTNISERVRELATIKVLGFYDKEVHLYVNKETLILTGLGILLGLPLGHLLGGCLTYVLNMPSIYFEVSIHPVSYAIAAVISFLFACIVDLITNRTLDHIDMVEALKSVE